MNDAFQTIAVPARAELRVLGSRFIAQTFAVETRVEAHEALERVRATLHDATHHCHAYRLGHDGKDARSSDAGEPSGTAGRPIMAVLERAELTNVLVVVSRYFGGTKLGTGRLARAYAEAASAVIRLSQREERIIHSRLLIALPHHLIGELMHLVALFGARVAGGAFDETARYEVDVRASREEEFCRALTERTGAASRVERIGERAAPRPIDRRG